MRAVVQRVSQAAVRCGGKERRVDQGLLVLVAVEEGDGEGDLAWIVDKVVHLRIFENDRGKMDRSVVAVGGEIMVVSQFTLAASLAKGRRPDFTPAERPEVAERWVEDLVERMQGSGCRVVTGFFGAHMEVALVNDGPVTIWLDSRRRK